MVKNENISNLIVKLKTSEDYNTFFFPKTNTYSSGVGFYIPKLQRIIRLGSPRFSIYASIYSKFKIKYEVIDMREKGFIYKNLIYKPYKQINHHQSSFIVLNSNFIRQKLKNKIFDDTFINGHEDNWFSYKYLQNSKFKMSNFRITGLIGSSLGTNIDRVFREIANEIYFEYLSDKHIGF